MYPGQMTRKELILYSIQDKFGSIANFSRETGIPDSTIRNIKNRDDESLDSMGVGIFVKICSALDLDVEDLMKGNFRPRTIAPRPGENLSGPELELVGDFRKLTDKNKRLLLAVEEMFLNSQKWPESKTVSDIAAESK